MYSCQELEMKGVVAVFLRLLKDANSTFPSLHHFYILSESPVCFLPACAMQGLMHGCSSICQVLPKVEAYV